MKQTPLLISCSAEDLPQGLFGNVYYYVFQVLPYLYARRIFPAWEIRALHYGELPDLLTIPGSLDLAYQPPAGPFRTVPLNELRRRHGQVLGNDWVELSRIWKAYFRIPQRVLERAENVLPQGHVLGVHYRGTDKQTTSWDSNPITQEQYLLLIQEFLEDRPEIEAIFAATDEFSFVEKLESAVHLPVIALGEVDFHMATEGTVSRGEKTDRAVLDCVLLSRCHTVIETSSALPSFAKLLNPDQEIYRCAASKAFNDMPYFPVAFVPMLPVKSAACTEILRLTMDSDWTHDARMMKFKRTFTSAPRWPVNHRIFSLADRLGAEEIVARLVTGYR
ncbi:MAG: hypothetical protein NVSMB3_07000 [Acidobacteriaceae bacterium]